MEATSLLSLPEGIQIEQIQITENGLVIESGYYSHIVLSPLFSTVIVDPSSLSPDPA
jgi:hypothetical protein